MTLVTVMLLLAANLSVPRVRLTFYPAQLALCRAVSTQLVRHVAAKTTQCAARWRAAQQRTATQRATLAV